MKDGGNGGGIGIQMDIRKSTMQFRNSEATKNGKEGKRVAGLSQEQVRSMFSHVYLSTRSVPIPDATEVTWTLLMYPHSAYHSI